MIPKPAQPFLIKHFTPAAFHIACGLFHFRAAVSIAFSCPLLYNDRINMR